MHHSNLGCKSNSLSTIDSVDVSPYKSMVYIYTLKRDKKEMVVVWETEFESLSYFLAYYLIGKQLFKIGELKIALSCTTCDDACYPIKSIRISKVNDDIEFSFLKDLDYGVSDSGWETYKAGTFKYQYSILQKKLKVVINQ